MRTKRTYKNVVTGQTKELFVDVYESFGTKNHNGEKLERQGWVETRSKAKVAKPDAAKEAEKAKTTKQA